jgi:hypothetical protein
MGLYKKKKEKKRLTAPTQITLSQNKVLAGQLRGLTGVVRSG